jgi:hypothetical protein
MASGASSLRVSSTVVYLTICFSLISPNGDLQAPGAPGTLNGHLSQDASEGFDTRFVSLHSGLTSLTSGLIYRPAPR